MNQWFLATRPWSLTASATPVCLGAVLAFFEGGFRPWLFLLTLAGALLLHLGTNLLNTYGDFISGVDSRESALTCPQLVSGQFQALHMKRAGQGVLLAALMVGLVLVAYCGWPLLIFGVAGMLGAYGYTTGVKPYKYLGLGPFMVFWLMGPLISAPTYYVQSGHLNAGAFCIGLPIAFLVTAILHANELRDIEHDRAAGIRTLSIYFGQRAGLWCYLGLVLSALLSLSVLVALGLIPTGALLALLLIPLYKKKLTFLTRAARYPARLNPEQKNELQVQINTLEGFSAESHFKFGMLMVVGILLQIGVHALWG